MNQSLVESIDLSTFVGRWKIFVGIWWGRTKVQVIQAVNFLCTSWRWLNPWKGHLTIPKRAQRIARVRFSPHLRNLSQTMKPWKTNISISDSRGQLVDGCLCGNDTVDGSEIQRSPVEVGSLSTIIYHGFYWIIHPRWLLGDFSHQLYH